MKNNYLGIGLGIAGVASGSYYIYSKRKKAKEIAELNNKINETAKEKTENEEDKEVIEQLSKAAKKKVFLMKLAGTAGGSASIAAGTIMVANGFYELNKTKVPETIVNKVEKVKFKLDCKKPEIALASSIIFTLGAVASSIYAYEKIKGRIETYNDYEEYCNAKLAMGKEVIDGEEKEYTQEDYDKDMSDAKKMTVIDCGKDALLPLACLTGSILSNITVYGTLSERLTSAALAYEGLDSQFKAYRDRVKADLGSDADIKFLTGCSTEKLKIDKVDEDGKTKKETVNVLKAPEEDNELYCNRIWAKEIEGHENTRWHESIGLTIVELRGMLSVLNLHLRTRGFVSLNEALEMFGYTPNPDYGTRVGWMDGVAGHDTINIGVDFDELERKYCGVPSDKIIIPIIFQDMMILGSK